MTQAIIDTHVHVWDLKRAAYDWLSGDESILNATWTLSQLEEDRHRAGVTHGVLVQAAGNKEDTALMLEAAAAADWIKGAVIWLPLMDTRETARQLDEDYANNIFVNGVRHQIHDEKDPRWLLQPAVLDSLQILADRGLPFDIVAINNQHIQTALEVADRIPSLRMIFDHLAQPPIETGELGEWGKLMNEASKHPNFYAKISGLGTASKNFVSWTAADIRPYIEFIINTFSPSRCCIGGDWPVAMLAGGYKKAMDAYLGVLRDLLSPEDLERVVMHTAIQFYNLKNMDLPA